MALTTVIEIADAILLSFGGGGVIVIAAAWWLGNVWTNLILGPDRKQYGEELKRVRRDLETQDLHPSMRGAP